MNGTISLPGPAPPVLAYRITSDCFALTAIDVGETLLRGWAEQYVPLTADVRVSLDRELYQPLRAAGRVYRLRDLGPTAYDDWGGIHNEFHELVLLDRDARIPALRSRQAALKIEHYRRLKVTPQRQLSGCGQVEKRPL